MNSKYMNACQIDDVVKFIQIVPIRKTNEMNYLFKYFINHNED